MDRTCLSSKCLMFLSLWYNVSWLIWPFNRELVVHAHLDDWQSNWVRYCCLLTCSVVWTDHRLGQCDVWTEWWFWFYWISALPCFQRIAMMILAPWSAAHEQPWVCEIKVISHDEVVSAWVSDRAVCHFGMELLSTLDPNFEKTRLKDKIWGG